MKAKVSKNRDITLINVEGNLNLTSLDELNFFCNKNLQKKKIIFNLHSLHFVGSVGIGEFSKTLETINKNNDLKICCASSEFEKILNNEGFSSYKTEQEALLSFDQSK
ncbi:MAG: STAS domain-containing protein [Bdellovibrionales bacterium]